MMTNASYMLSQPAQLEKILVGNILTSTLVAHRLVDLLVTDNFTALPSIPSYLGSCLQQRLIMK
jgi:hypothetical protein